MRLSKSWVVFCKNASNAQLRGIFDKECNADRRFNAYIARLEAKIRGIDVSDWPSLPQD